MEPGQPNPEAPVPELWRQTWEALSDAFELAGVTKEDLRLMDPNELLGAVYTARLEASLDDQELEERLLEAGITEPADPEE